MVHDILELYGFLSSIGCSSSTTTCNVVGGAGVPDPHVRVVCQTYLHVGQEQVIGPNSLTFGDFTFRVLIYTPDLQSIAYVAINDIIYYVLIV